jgi:hypothetical protein
VPEFVPGNGFVPDWNGEQVNDGTYEKATRAPEPAVFPQSALTPVETPELT